MPILNTKSIFFKLDIENAGVWCVKCRRMPQKVVSVNMYLKKVIILSLTQENPKHSPDYRLHNLCNVRCFSVGTKRLQIEGLIVSKIYMLYSGDPKSGRVRILNGPPRSSFPMVSAW